ncbi:DUF4406 domain-containing protein [Shewanella sp.]|uniref:DUF4406 domain-containing protein n=1 Tax=Shewanella sp. TaxID=50422 RepID=UPI003D1308BD
MNGQICYIAGPMSGLPNCNRHEFNLAAKVRSAFGEHVLNPATLPDGLTEQQYMAIGLQMLMAADLVYVLDGFENSAGANAEIALAQKLGTNVVYQDGADHQTILFGYDEADHY